MKKNYIFLMVLISLLGFSNAMNPEKRKSVNAGSLRGLTRAQRREKPFADYTSAALAGDVRYVSSGHALQRRSIRMKRNLSSDDLSTIDEGTSDLNGSSEIFYSGMWILHKDELDEGMAKEIYEYSSPYIKDLIQKISCYAETKSILPRCMSRIQVIVGDHGIGKTALANTIVSRTKLPYERFTSKSYSELLSQLITVQQDHKPQAIILEDMRSEDVPWKYMFDELRHKDNLLFIVNVRELNNVPQEIENYIDGLHGIHQVDLPDVSRRERIIQYHIEHLAKDMNVTFRKSSAELAKRLAKRTKNFTPRNLEMMVSQGLNDARLRCEKYDDEHKKEDKFEKDFGEKEIDEVKKQKIVHQIVPRMKYFRRAASRIKAIKTKTNTIEIPQIIISEAPPLSEEEIEIQEFRPPIEVHEPQLHVGDEPLPKPKPKISWYSAAFKKLKSYTCWFFPSAVSIGLYHLISKGIISYKTFEPLRSIFKTT